MLKQRVLAAALLIPGFLLALFFSSPWVWMILMGVGTLLAAWEWARLAGYAAAGQIFYTLLVFALLLGIAMLGTEGMVPQALNGGVLVFWLALVPLWLARHWVVRRRWVLTLVGLMVLLPTWLALIALRDSGVWLLLFLMLLVWVADIAAYVFGRLWGKHKLAPRISPGKTWEGVAGALFSGVLYALLWRSFAPDSQTHFAEFSLLGSILIVAFLVAISIVGDLFESHLKRCAGLKDSGNLIPGHGGILDRIDSLTSVLPIAVACLYFLRG